MIGDVDQRNAECVKTLIIHLAETVNKLEGFESRQPVKKIIFTSFQAETLHPTLYIPD